MQVLVNGEQAYPAMIQAIDAAIETIGFASYIFNHVQSDWNLWTHSEDPLTVE